MAHQHDTSTPAPEAPADQGALIRWPKRYDLLVGLALAGRGNRVRADIADAISLQPGHSVLDVGCGTGTLTLALAQRAGPTGRTEGVDASAEMIAAAQQKANHQQIPVRFQVAAAQALPYPDETFDAVATSLMIHHLPAADRIGVLKQMLRVLRPGGQLVIAEFQAPTWPLARQLTEHLLGHDMAANDLDDIRGLAAAAGVSELRDKSSSVSWLGLITGRKPLDGALG